MNYGPKFRKNKYGEPISRPSSISEEDRYREDGTDEWYVTEDGYEFKEGDKLWNYYDSEWVYIGKMRYEDGWFDTHSNPELEGIGTMLNSVRLSKNPPDWYKGDK